jgi:hypothetical protein
MDPLSRKYCLPSSELAHKRNLIWTHPQRNRLVSEVAELLMEQEPDSQRESEDSSK